ncbi:DUF1059 domain-containing protein [Corallococcus sp. bb12-1]|uniref:DUF1059 domain-containing protein n=1 Tax=Corallococcus sp. bb12-1 TaxID=2996784 RepID=UPI00227016F1|nr:DUF1059 domain-containing protein [Corallococcus sp. bb12-1]MCY1043941.1 DUF1059 domain-containing protein [Corallococcus sp. bb12-1]
MSRKMMDCRETPDDSNCTLTITGEEDEVVRAATEHAVSVHGHQDIPALREMIRISLKDEPGFPTGESVPIPGGVQPPGLH